MRTERTETISTSCLDPQTRRASGGRRRRRRRQRARPERAKSEHSHTATHSHTFTHTIPVSHAERPHVQSMRDVHVKFRARTIIFFPHPNSIRRDANTEIYVLIWTFDIH